MGLIDQEITWFLAQVKPNCAEIAKRNLGRQNFQTFLPMEEETIERNEKFVTTNRPLFPGYIFVAMDVAMGLWRKVNSTHGITKLVSFGLEPSPVPRGVVFNLKQRCDDTGKLLPPKVFQSGDKVVLTNGPFANFVAEVEKISRDRRIWVLMDIMGGRTRVEVGAHQLKAS